VQAVRSRHNGAVSAPRDEVQAAVEARRELGPAHEAEIIDGFLERMERSIDRRVDERLAERRTTAPRKRDPDYVVTFVSLGVSIPLMGIAGGIAGLAGIIVVCLAIVLVNAIVWLRR
jgi:hypothetical protein